MFHIFSVIEGKITSCLNGKDVNRFIYDHKVIKQKCRNNIWHKIYEHWLSSLIHYTAEIQLIIIIRIRKYFHLTTSVTVKEILHYG
jgi:hypothetical protein